LSFAQRIINGESNKVSLRIPQMTTLEVNIKTPEDNFVSASNTLQNLRGSVNGISGEDIFKVSIKKNGNPILGPILLDKGTTAFSFDGILLSKGINTLEVYCYKIDNPSEVLASKTITVIYKVSGIDNAKYHALLVACEEYDDNKIPRLRNPIKETTAFANVLKEKYGFEVEILQNVKKEYFGQKLLEYKDKLKEDDNFLIFFSGHGINANKDSHWQFTNAVSWNIYEGSFSAKELIGGLNSYKSKHILVMSDACFSGNFCARTGETATENFNFTDEFVEKKYNLVSMNIMTSSTNETSPDKSEFTSSFVAYIQSNTQKYILSDYIFENIRNKVSGSFPLSCTFSGDKGGGFFFTLK
jgi:hypothetical protein